MVITETVSDHIRSGGQQSCLNADGTICIEWLATLGHVCSFHPYDVKGCYFPHATDEKLSNLPEFAELLKVTALAFESGGLALWGWVPNRYARLFFATY